MSKQAKKTVPLQMRKGVKNGKPYWESTELSVEDLLTRLGTISCKFQADEISGDNFELVMEPPYGDKIEEPRFGDKRDCVFMSLWHRTGVGKRSGQPYSFYSSGNMSLMKLRSEIGESVKIFVGPSKSENPKAAPFYMSIRKYEKRARQGGGGDSQAAVAGGDNPPA